jgi:sulfur-carrier protein adenylyltransferase/sulfurtransferase
MIFMDMFSRVKTMDADEAREWMKGRSPESFTLLDVRQPGEYERGHLPGAVLIPLPELEKRLGEINPEIPVLAY